MSRITGLLALVFALVLPLMSAPPGLAIDLSNDRGEQIFSSNCAACHMGGGNVIRASRTLKIRDLNAHLEEYQQDPLEAIEHQIEDVLSWFVHSIFQRIEILPEGIFSFCLIKAM